MARYHARQASARGPKLEKHTVAVPCNFVANIFPLAAADDAEIACSSSGDSALIIMRPFLRRTFMSNRW
jgi:hypothetical protein